MLDVVISYVVIGVVIGRAAPLRYAWEAGCQQLTVRTVLPKWELMIKLCSVGAGAAA